MVASLINPQLNLRINAITFSGSQKKSNNPATGSKVRLWKQDPSVTDPGIRTAFIHTPIEKGPKDDQIVIKGLPTASPDSNGDFLFDHTKDPKRFDSVHTFSVIRQVVTMFNRALKRMGFQKDFEWQWGNRPINVYPHAGKMANAYYSRNERALKFFYFTPADKSKNDVYTTRSMDIVSHEAGHAILDGLKPGYFNSWHPQTGGLHESFGDLSAIFTLLSQLDMCEAVVAESKANLHNKTFISALAEEFGEALGRPMGLRNADNKLKLSDVSTEVHDISQVFTGAIYDILADMFEDSLKMDREDPALTLFNVGQHLNDLLVTGIQRSPDKNATYKDVAEQMIAAETNPKWQDFIRKRFTEREIMLQSQGSSIPQFLSWKKCCPTLRRPEHVLRVNQAIQAAQAQFRPDTKKTK